APAAADLKFWSAAARRRFRRRVSTRRITSFVCSGRVPQSPPHESGRRAAPSKAEPRLRTPNWLSRHLECGGTTPLLTASLDSPPPPVAQRLKRVPESRTACAAL